MKVCTSIVPVTGTLSSAKEANRTVCDKATGTAIAAAIALFRNDFFIVRLPLSSFDFFHILLRQYMTNQPYGRTCETLAYCTQQYRNVFILHILAHYFEIVNPLKSFSFKILSEQSLLF
jgi:hypothetical protein